MIKNNKYCFNNNEAPTKKLIGNGNNDEKKKRFKKELLDVFQKNGYLAEGKDYEIKIRTTSGNIAWININCIETIK